MDNHSSNQGSPLKHRSLEYNQETVKKKKALDNILNQAKQDYKNDK